jgi:hypothetical protein
MEDFGGDDDIDDPVTTEVNVPPDATDADDGRNKLNRPGRCGDSSSSS